MKEKSLWKKEKINVYVLYADKSIAWGRTVMMENGYHIIGYKYV